MKTTEQPSNQFSKPVKQDLTSFIQVLQTLFIALSVAIGILIFMFPDVKELKILGAVSLACFVLLLLVSQQSSQSINKLKFEEKARIYLVSGDQDSTKDSVVLARADALQYCQDLVNDYKSTRNQSRNLYYGLQIATIVLSGITPILVLVDKLEAGQTWLKWLPVICPALASIIASVATSFSFEKTWTSARTTVELLEAELEKFILGVTPNYRCYDLLNEGEEQQKIKVKQAIENFIIQVNTIHLQQVQEAANSKPQEEKPKLQEEKL